MEVVECVVEAAAELREYEDEGPGFFLAVAPNVLLFLQGQELMFDDFPTESLVLTRDARTRCVFDLTHTGRPVKPSRTIATRRFGGTDWLDSGTFIRGTVRELPDEIGALPKQDDVLDEVLEETDTGEDDGRDRN